MIISILLNGGDHMASKHLSYEERLKIQEGLSQNKAIFAIAKSIKRTNTAIRNEITRNRYLVTEKSYTIHTCENRNDCYLMHICGDMECNKYCMGCIRVCNHPECPKYVPAQCEKTTSAPFVCNGCELLGSGKCKYPKYLYNARRAQIVYEDKLKASRQGIALTPEEMSELDNLVSPLLLQGQSIKAVFLNHKDEMPCSERTLYNYVDGCYLTARNLDLPRKVKYKVRYKTNDKRNKQPFTFDRTYADFKKFLMDNPDVNIVEMDTVIGSQGGKILLTLLFRNCSLMIGILLERKTIDAVAEALNNICEAIGIKRFQKLFGVILTDRGTEFSNPYAIESDPNGEIKTRVFYCDPYSSWQKGMIEKNHEFIRYIIPSGKSFDNLSQQDITLMMNHINNYPRENLNGATPYALAKLLIDEKLLEVLHFHKIRPDAVVMKPMLLHKPTYKNYPENSKK